MREWTTHSAGPRETQELGRRLGQLARPGLVVLLAGDLGAGKTCFAQGVADGLGTPADTPVTSPSYTLLNIHYGRLPLYHFDLYRIERNEELDRLFFEEYWEDDGVSVIEWADRAHGRLPAERVNITIEYLDDTSRSITIEYPGD